MSPMFTFRAPLLLWNGMANVNQTTFCWDLKDQWNQHRSWLSSSIACARLG